MGGDSKQVKIISDGGNDGEGSGKRILLILVFPAGKTGTEQED